MAKKPELSRDEQEKANMEKMQKRVENLLPDKANIPASISIQQAEELKARVKELETNLARQGEIDKNKPTPNQATDSPVSATLHSLSSKPGAMKKNTRSVMSTQQRRGLSLRARITMAITFTSMLAMLTIGYFSFSRNTITQAFLGDQLQETVKKQSEQQITSLVDKEAENIDQIFLNVNRDVKATAAYTTNLLNHQTSLSENKYWDAVQKLSPLASGALDNPNSDPAAVFVPSFVPFTPEQIADLNTLLQLDFVGPDLLKTNPNIVGIYYIDKLGVTVYYPNIDLANLVPGDFSAAEQGFFTIVSPQNNPDRKSAWTPPYQDPALTGLIVTNSAPVYDGFGKFQGVIGADVQLSKITEQVKEISIGKTGYAFLIDPAGRIIAMPDSGYADLAITPEQVAVNETPKQTILELAPQEMRSLVEAMTRGETGLTTIDINNDERYLAYVPISTTGYSLGVLVPTAEMNIAYTEVQNNVQREAQYTINYGLGLLIATLLVAIIVSFASSGLLTTSLKHLTETARKVGAGDLSAKATAKSSDEIGVLASSFNSMTSQLSDLFNSLEERVADRTHDLELASEVGRTIAEKVGNVSLMLTDATEMIRSRFNLYYTQVYLLDPSGQTITLRAGTGTTGQQLLRRGHHLLVSSSSLNGRAVSEKKPVIVADTEKSDSFLPNPLLPNTRSEMAIPLLVGDRVLGVLDMQSETPDALNEDNLAAFQVLAGQLSVAIQNATLFAQSEEARKQVEDNVRQISTVGWLDFLNGTDRGEKIGYVFDQTEVKPLERKSKAKSNNALSVPITVTGATVGTIQVAQDEREWTASESLIVQSTANQLAQHIENLRLLSQAEKYRQEAEQTTRRLTREGWEGYLQTRNRLAAGYSFNPNEVKTENEEIETVSSSTLSLPITVRDEAIGELMINAENIDHQTIDEIFPAVAAQLGAHIENLRLAEQNEQALVETEQLSRQNKLILDSAGEGIFGLDADGNHTFVNPTAAQLLGYTVEELIGKHSHTIWHHTKPDGSPYPDDECPIYHSIHLNKVEQGDEVFIRKDGSSFAVDFTSTPFMDGEHSVGAVVTFRDVTERKQAEEILRLAQKRAQNILESVTVPMVITRLKDNTLTFINQPATEVAKIKYEEAINQPSPDFYYDVEERAKFISELRAKGQVSNMTVQLLRGDKEIFWALLSARMFEYQGEPSILTTFMDITERIRAQESVIKRAAELQTVAELSITTATTFDPDHLLQSVVDLAKDKFNLYHAHIYLADESWNTLLLAAGADEIGRQMVDAGHAIQMDTERSLVARATRERKAIIINDVRSEPDFLPNLMLPETRAEMAVPMIMGDKVIGVFDVQSEIAGRFTQEDASIFTTLASQVAVALQNARLYVEQSATVTQLRELDRLKSSFLANMSHELRTPLNSILGFADVMLEELDGPLTENMSNDLSLIHKNGQHLLHLINDVLDMAKIDSGKMNLSIDNFNLQETIEEVVSITSLLANEKNLSLFIEPDSDHDVNINADKIRLRQVMINLINNAMKFTEKGSISIRVEREEDNVLISVKDTGIGIPVELLESVFQEFTQVDTSTTRKTGGTGLGLPISRRLIEMHSGRLWAESSGIDGEGATFYVFLPIEATTKV